MDTQTWEVEQVDMEPVTGLGIREVVNGEAALPAFFDGAFGEIAAYIGAHGGAFAGPPFAQYFNIDATAVDVQVVFPTARPLDGSGRIEPVSLPGGSAAQVEYLGPYEEMVPAYDAINAWLATTGRRASGPPREIYFTSPKEEPDPAKWRTVIVQPIE